VARDGIPSITSADKSVWGSTARRTLAQADRSNIHAGSPVRVGCSQVAANDNTARSGNCLMNANPQAQQFPTRGTVGVLKFH
jgi:hypothetical protein